MSFVYVVPPYTPPPSVVSPWVKTTHEWVGWNGDTFNLSHPRGGVFLTQGGTKGMGMPEETPWTRTGSPFVHGQTYTGGIVDAREVFWPIYLFSDGGSAAWQEFDSRFWATLQFGKPGTWRVTTTAGTRELRCRFVSDGGHAFTRDPHKFGWQSYGIEMVADDAFWTPTAPVEQSWANDPPQQFYGGGPVGVEPPKAAPFYISSGSSLATATLDNPGDVEAWVIWTVEGPAQNIRLGVGGRQVTYPGEVPEGSVLTINTDPMDQLAYLDGEDVTDLLGLYSFSPIPAGGETSLDLSIDGTGNVRASFMPRFYRGW